MKIHEGDLVRVIKKIHPWKRTSRREYFGLQGVVTGRVYVAKSKSVPSGIIVLVKIGSKVARIPINHLKRIQDAVQDSKGTQME